MPEWPNDWFREGCSNLHWLNRRCKNEKWKNVLSVKINKTEGWTAFSEIIKAKKTLSKQTVKRKHRKMMNSF